MTILGVIQNYSGIIDGFKSMLLLCTRSTPKDKDVNDDLILA